MPTPEGELTALEIDRLTEKERASRKLAKAERLGQARSFVNLLEAESDKALERQRKAITTRQMHSNRLRPEEAEAFEREALEAGADYKRCRDELPAALAAVRAAETEATRKGP